MCYPFGNYYHKWTLFIVILCYSLSPSAGHVFSSFYMLVSFSESYCDFLNFHRAFK